MSDFNKRKWIQGLLVLCFFLFGYFFFGHFHIQEPKMLPLTWVDKNTPRLPWTIWIYVSEYLIFLLLIFYAKTPQLMKRMIIAFSLCLGGSFVVFFLYPTILPRDHLLHVESNGFNLNVWMFNLIKTIDVPGNCFPSLHVAICFLAGFVFLDVVLKRAVLLILWTLAICVSTLTTKQHYFYDIPSGFLLALLSFGLSLMWVPWGAGSPNTNRFFLSNWFQSDKKACETAPNREG